MARVPVARPEQVRDRGIGPVIHEIADPVAAIEEPATLAIDVPEGRPLWKTVPIQLAFTAITGIFLVVSALSVFLTGQLAELAYLMLPQEYHMFDTTEARIILL